MKSSPNKYKREAVKDLFGKGIFSDNELIASGVTTMKILGELRNVSLMSSLPNVANAIKESVAECKDGRTDVFFFGIPSTGKTCVLMGLSRSPSLDVYLASGGGKYAEALQLYTDKGITFPRTPGTFVTTLEASISYEDNPEVVHDINLVEMSGEEFAFAIADNPEHKFSFEEMGSGATELLKNDNRKVFFLIIDPTADEVTISRDKVVRYDEVTKEPITEGLEYCSVNQRIIVKKIVDIFRRVENADIMKKVDSIHIIMTKADTLGKSEDRKAKSLEVFKNIYSNDIRMPLIKLCRKYNINSQTGFTPKLFSFSLGHFYPGEFYEYEQGDSDCLIKAIFNSTHGRKEITWWDKLKNMVN